jgi:hypothetical protein
MKCPDDNNKDLTLCTRRRYFTTPGDAAAIATTSNRETVTSKNKATSAEE